jgi:hypothetical protein
VITRLREDDTRKSWKYFCKRALNGRRVTLPPAPEPVLKKLKELKSNAKQDVLVLEYRIV